MPIPKPVPYWSTTDRRTVMLYHGHAPTVMSRLPAESVQCVATSPPYWGLRDYQVQGQLGAEPSPDCGTQGRAQCGACFVCNVVSCFRQVRRMLRDDGTAWLNLGDTYSGGSGITATTSDKQRSNGGTMIPPRPGLAALPDGNLIGVPWRVALALQADGWLLRQDVIWSKPAPMPESVRNRCTKAHEYVFLLAKSPGYYCDMEAIKLPEKDIKSTSSRVGGSKYTKAVNETGNSPQRGRAGGLGYVSSATSNRRDVWAEDDHLALLSWLMEHHPEAAAEFLGGSSYRGDVWRVPPYSYKGAHFATFPPKLVETCILAGTSAKGCCAECGSPLRRVTERVQVTRPRPNQYVKRTGEDGTGNSCPNGAAGVEVRTVGWDRTCRCATTETRPCIVLDPFIGSGTTAYSCVRNNRACWGIDLNGDYLRDHAIPRAERALGSHPTWCELLPSWEEDGVRAESGPWGEGHGGHDHAQL